MGTVVIWITINLLETLHSVAVEITNKMHKFAPLLYFYMLAPTCFGSSLPSSGSFWIRLRYVKIQIDMVVYLKYITDKNQCVKRLVQNKTD
jgi:hypothetical protein